MSPPMPPLPPPVSPLVHEILCDLHNRTGFNRLWAMCHVIMYDPKLKKVVRVTWVPLKTPEMFLTFKGRR